ncbi:hypothetical protein [Roseinatronobacter alkalisoli]|uniref:Transferrin-binding protein B C-lobe/N-lobe beta barrel domain-containing protein n=1 Tax=Roseinatronobacter alkalisoli TaxID=3028235 RepID=A0ABT5TDJ2_9RHOB|nr:hypothetical protein [Roseinatronobacter sp. HJB301]MDD7971958.1 hypothetical protein [Roseinatronobacter sp. HJB301]
MIKRYTLRRTGVMITASVALAGCLGGGGGAGGGGGGGGGAGTVTQHDARFDQISGMIPTTDMPTTGSADYAGSVKTVLNEGSTPIGTLLGDIEMQLNFGQAFADPASQSVSGRIHNIRGTVGTEDVTYEGELTTAAAAAPSTMSINQMAIAGTTVTTGVIASNFGGELTLDGTTGNANLMLGGAFVGAGGQAASGPAVGGWWRPGGLSDYTVGGTWYIERQ